MGQLGLGATYRSKIASEEWVEVMALRGHQVTSLACGSQHSAVVTAVGDVYTWGRGFEGQTGHPCAIKNLTLPTPISGDIASICNQFLENADF